MPRVDAKDAQVVQRVKAVDHWGMGLQRKMALWVIAAALIAEIIAAPITFVAVDRMLLVLKEQQLRSELGDVGNSINNLMGVGLPLAALRRTQHLLEQARSRDPEIGSILVFDAAGQILYSTDLGEVGSTAPPDWMQRDGGGVVRDPDEIVALIPLNNSFGARVGGVALRFDMSNHVGQREELWLLIAAVSAGGLVLTALVADRLSRSMLHHLHEGLEALIADMEAMVAGNPSPPLPPSIPRWLLRSYLPFAERVRLTLDQLESQTRELARMDEAG